MKGNIQEAPVLVLLQHMTHIFKQQSIPLFRKFGLTPGSAGILFTLSKYGTMSQRELAERVGITPPSMTVALKKMEKQNYISREPDEKDQRIIRIRLLEKGEKCVVHVKQAIKQLEETAFEGVSQEEHLLLRRILIQMYQNLMKKQEREE